VPAVPGSDAGLLDNPVWAFLKSRDLLRSRRRRVLIDPRVSLGLCHGRQQQRYRQGAAH